MKKFLKYFLYIGFCIYLILILYLIFFVKIPLNLRNTLIYIGAGVAVLVLIIEIFWS
ncbi:MAG: hypothetical protein ABDH23_02240 [Endomicrobiia bacterium]